MTTKKAGSGATKEEKSDDKNKSQGAQGGDQKNQGGDQNPKEQSKEDAAAEKAKAEERAKEEERLKKVASENAELKRNREKELKKRDYVPEPGTGNRFHIVAESPNFNSTTGKKVSEAKKLVLEGKEFTAWLRNAPRLRMVFSMLHDASPFLPQRDKKALNDALAEYRKNTPEDLLKFEPKLGK